MIESVNAEVLQTSDLHKYVNNHTMTHFIPKNKHLNIFLILTIITPSLEALCTTKSGTNNHHMNKNVQTTWLYACIVEEGKKTKKHKK